MNRMKLLLLFAFGLSGFTALTYQVVWSRLFQTFFGSTVYTASAVFAAFLLGFSIGSFLFRNIATSRYHPTLVIAAIETALGAYGILIIFILKFLSHYYLFIPDVLIIELLVAMLILLPPAILFGALWPTIYGYYTDDLKRIGSETGNLYSVNSFGSGLGALASGFIIIPMFGFQTTSLLAVSINLAISAVLFWCYRQHKKLTLI